ncbi:MAG: ISKra4 family transposase [Hormoscilla sp. GM7CHS1pb]|nr:ISKra4 family transposase [Hormoscilla sp. GM7CHS1pb]MBC6479263.1 ISKra4 family transposase [Hormoscilla sp. GM7CHS1pb]
MNPKIQAQIEAHAQAIAALLHEQALATVPEQLTTLEGIEGTVRSLVLQYVSPEIAPFFIAKESGTRAGHPRAVKSIVGELKLTSQQAQYFEVKAYSQWSPYLEKCCLELSGNSSYEQSARQIKLLTGMKVSRGTQQRLVQRYEFSSGQVSHPVQALSLDGGKVRLRTELGEPCQWRDYKAVNLNGEWVGAYFRDNERLVDKVNQQTLEVPVFTLGDGHDGIWNILKKISNRVEILDWYHLMENLEKVGGSQQRLDRVKELLWKGQVKEANRKFEDWEHERVDRFKGYVEKHQHRIVNYEYYQAEEIPIGSGQVESTVGRGARVKLSGAQWKEENVPQVLRHRCACLNGVFTTLRLDE